MTKKYIFFILGLILSQCSDPVFAQTIGPRILAQPVPVANGGTGSTTASGARSNLSAAAKGANSDITSITGLTTALTQAQGGTGTTSLGAATMTPTGGSSASLANLLSGNATLPALELSSNGTNVFSLAGGTNLNINNNINPSSQYIITGAATRIQMTPTGYNFQSGPSETAGTSITGLVNTVVSFDSSGDIVANGTITGTSILGLTTPLAQSLGGTGATSLGAATMTPTGGVSGTLNALLSGNATLPSLEISGNNGTNVFAIAGGANFNLSNNISPGSLYINTGTATRFQITPTGLAFQYAASGTAGTSASGALTTVFTLDSSGNIVNSGNITLSGANISETGTVLSFNTAHGISFSLVDPGSTIANNAYMASAASGGNPGFQVQGSDTNVGFNFGLKGTGSLVVYGGLTLPSIANSGQTSAVCYGTGGVITYNSGATTCLVSSARFKNIKRTITPEEGLQIALAAKPMEYTNKVHPQGDEVGLICEQLEKIDPRLVDHDNRGRCSGVRYEQYSGGILTAAIQELKYDNDNLKNQILKLNSFMNKYYLIHGKK